ncbi:MAG: hypothetical protein KC619_32525, partial [Myxococcales bacterium]|nr:hypothetical protein [Myxococcales bacterium]
MRRTVGLALLLGLLAAPASARVIGWPDHPFVREAIDRTRPAIASCLEDYRVDDAASSVRFGAQLRVRSDGVVVQVTLDRAAPLTAGQRYCVRRTLEGVRLRPPRA